MKELAMRTPWRSQGHRPGWNLRVVVGIGALILTLGIIPPTAGETRGQPGLPDNPLQGRLLFEDKRCVECHGISGQGPGIAPDLGEGHFRGSFLDLGASLWNHVPGMSVTFEVAGFAWPELDEKEAGQLIAFLYFIDYLGHPGVASAGEEVFTARGCNACHTVGGGSAVASDLAELQHFASPLYVAQQIWNHGPAMLESMAELGIAPPSFEPGDLADLSAFIRQKAPPGPQQRMLLAPGNPNRGGDLFRAKGCATCHGNTARGGSGGPDVTEVDLHRSAETIAGTMWNHALAMSATMRERGVGWPQLTTTELADLVAFLYFLPFSDPRGDPDLGAQIFATHSCSGCHGGDAEGAHAGPELVGVSATASPAAFVAAVWNHAPLMRRAVLREGLPWPELTGEDLRNLLAFLSE